MYPSGFIPFEVLGREFLQAIEQYKRLYRRPFPTWREVLHVFKSLGWRKLPASKNSRKSKIAKSKRRER